VPTRGSRKYAAVPAAHPVLYCHDYSFNTSLLHKNGENVAIISIFLQVKIHQNAFGFRSESFPSCGKKEIPIPFLSLLSAFGVSVLSVLGTSTLGASSCCPGTRLLVSKSRRLWIQECFAVCDYDGSYY